MSSLKKDNLIFWIITIIFSAFMIFTSIPEILLLDADKKFMGQLGFPDYISPFLGVMKVLGIIAILITGFPRIKEWAYAGLFFDLVGATYSQLAMAGLEPSISFMLLPIILLFISYRYYHKRLKRTADPVS